MNTEEAFELLKDAGVNEEIGIQMVRRWLRERKVNFEGTVRRKAGYILKDTDQAFEMLKDAGVAENMSILTVRRWLREGKIQNVGEGSPKIQFLSTETSSHHNSAEQEKLIRQLQAKIKAQDEHIKGLEQLHKSSIHTMIQQREKLNKEILNLENERSELQSESKNLLKENIHLRSEILKLKEELYKGGKREPEKAKATPPVTNTNDYRRKLGLSKTATHKEVLAGYKTLLKVTHPDQGGNATAFQYIKTDYDHFRKSVKD
jgi:regulator of replication initiation timing